MNFITKMYGHFGRKFLWQIQQNRLLNVEPRKFCGKSSFSADTEEKHSSFSYHLLFLSYFCHNKWIVFYQLSTQHNETFFFPQSKNALRNWQTTFLVTWSRTSYNSSNMWGEKVWGVNFSVFHESLCKLLCAICIFFSMKFNVELSSMAFHVNVAFSQY